MNTTNKDTGQFKLRLPDDLKGALKGEAAANERTVNAEIVHRLRSTFKGKRTRQPSGDALSTEMISSPTSGNS